ncbi:hypothetical protein GcC1_013047 [Golovinomyces cichoracearum]|uniref:CCHC-type domain-containing protein n=1 Tax=Golovinomyces cichoracearum TaxID=62708 RepID=A0A420J752_9PEZI|nr:hypothetical protein GcC1_013047 [Golovinomyces cichoracearum]
MITNNTPLTVLDFHCLWRLDVAAPPLPEQLEANSSTELVLDPFLAAVCQRLQMVGPHQKAQILEQLTGIAVETPVPMLDPAPMERTRGRPPGSSSQRAFVNTSSTQRDPSQFEYFLNATQPGPSRRRCGICKVIGHNARTCPQRLVFSPEDNRTPAAP